MKVLVAEDDDLAQRMLSALLLEAGYEVEHASDGLTAAELLEGPDPPSIALLDWMMPGLTGVEVCRRLRARSGAPRIYVLLVSGRGRRQDALEGLEAGADDFVAKPYAPEELLARVRVAERVMSSAATSSGLVLEALSEALRGPGGEVVIRCGEAVGRIFVHHGRIAWAHVSTEPSSLYELLDPDAGLSNEDLRGVIDECKRSRRSLGDVLVAWGLVDRARFRARLQRWIARKLDAILHLPHPSVLFIPQARTYAGDLTFTLDEVLLPESLPRSVPPPSSSADMPASLRAWADAAGVASPEAQAELRRCLEEAMRIEGARSAAMLDAETGRCVGQRGEPVDLDLALEQLRVARKLGPGEAEELLASSRQLFHLMRAAAAAPTWFVYVALHRPETTLAMARLQLEAIAGARLR